MRPPTEGANAIPRIRTINEAEFIVVLFWLIIEHKAKDKADK